LITLSNLLKLGEKLGDNLNAAISRYLASTLQEVQIPPRGKAGKSIDSKPYLG